MGSEDPAHLGAFCGEVQVGSPYGSSHSIIEKPSLNIYRPPSSGLFQVLHLIIQTQLEVLRRLQGLLGSVHHKALRALGLLIRVACGDRAPLFQMVASEFFQGTRRCHSHTLRLLTACQSPLRPSSPSHHIP